jgi:cytochrome c2
MTAVAACSSDRRSTDVNAPDPEHGRELATTTGCGACHVIGGVPDANGAVGPPLTGIAQRSYIAGMLPNTPQNLALWIRSPQSVKPGNAMPDLGLSAREAQDIAAFLMSRY